MSIIGTSFIPDNNCPCEESEVIFKEVQKGVWQIVDWRCYGCAKQMKPEPDVYSNFGVEGGTR